VRTVEIGIQSKSGPVFYGTWCIFVIKCVLYFAVLLWATLLSFVAYLLIVTEC